MEQTKKFEFLTQNNLNYSNQITIQTYTKKTKFFFAHFYQ